MGHSIAADVERDLSAGGNLDLEQDFQPSERQRRHENRPRITNAEDFMTDILDAQQRLISAQHQFLHDNDLQALARAQLDVISTQTAVLQRLGVYGPYTG